MNPLNIKVPYFSAGKKYQWGNVHGIGLSHDLIKDNEQIRITVGKDKTIYTISREKAVREIKNYGSVEFHKGKKIGIVPFNSFEPEDKTETLF